MNTPKKIELLCHFKITPLPSPFHRFRPISDRPQRRLNVCRCVREGLNVRATTWAVERLLRQRRLLLTA
ncbi:hypothetical protein V6Z11_D12G076900 [Gossypium hirsutum]|uniref:Uncharacterized protein n=1 Tax=Gossypium darwinii TaxID=34276 RepID=A0A5D2A714_GOSDA|nr:hypothetical protein ES288_D12G078400v1 [Gossypium darwinii]